MTSLVGHDNAEKIFLQSLQQGNLHHGWILAGPKGLGKSKFAVRAAQILLNIDAGEGAGDANFYTPVKEHVTSMMLAGSHPDYRFLRRGPKTDKDAKKAAEEGMDALNDTELKRSIDIAQIRDLQPLFQSQSSMSKYRVVIIDAIDDIERSAANALLKSLEEPPKHTIFFLISHMPDRLLPTIRSRCQIIRFAPLNPEEMRQALLQHDDQMDAATMESLIEAGQGSPGQALLLETAKLSELMMLCQELMAEGDPDNAKRSELVKVLSPKAESPRYQAFLKHLPQTVAHYVRGLPQQGHLSAIDLWQQISTLAGQAQPKSLDNKAVIFQLGSLMARLSAHKDQP